MRNRDSLDFDRFQVSVNDIFRTAGYHNQIMDLTTIVIDDPTFLHEHRTLRFSLPTKLKDLKFFLIALRLMEPTWMTELILYQVQQTGIQKYDFEDRVFLRSILEIDRSYLVKFLFWTDEWSSQEFFGLLNQGILEKIFSSFGIIREAKSGKVREPQRKRGYDDKGSKRPSEKWLPTDGLFFDTLQELIEFEEKAVSARVNFSFDVMKLYFGLNDEENVRKVE